MLLRRILLNLVFWYVAQRCIHDALTGASHRPATFCQLNKSLLVLIIAFRLIHLTINHVNFPVKWQGKIFSLFSIFPYKFLSVTNYSLILLGNSIQLALKINSMM